MLRFRGSPAVLITGREPFLDGDAPVGLSCRVYRTGVEQLVEALGGHGDRGPRRG
jgi:hypothetical protein